MYRSNSYPKSRKSKKLLVFLLIFLIVGYVLLVSLLPIKNIQPTIVYKPKINNTYSPYTLPKQGSSLVFTEGFGELAAVNDKETRPIASITKIVTALTVLQAKPLQAGEQGPTITLTESDAQILQHYQSINGSTAPAPPGLKISELDALTTMLLPSANNYADTLAIWAYGSQENFVVAANKFLQSNNLSESSLADASGFSPNSKSSAKDLIKLGQMALGNPVLKNIVNKKSAIIPGIGEIKNTNFLLANNGVIGIKTGNTDEAKKCLLFAADYTINGQTITVFSALLGQETFGDLATNSQAMFVSAQNNFFNSALIKKNDSIGEYKTPWGESTKIIASDDLYVVTWQNNIPENQISANPISTNNTNLQVGKITSKSGTETKTTNLKIPNQLKGPSIIWRLTHPLKVLFS